MHGLLLYRSHGWRLIAVQIPLGNPAADHAEGAQVFERAHGGSSGRSCGELGCGSPLKMPIASGAAPSFMDLTDRSTWFPGHRRRGISGVGGVPWRMPGPSGPSRGVVDVRRGLVDCLAVLRVQPLLHSGPADQVVQPEQGEEERVIGWVCARIVLGDQLLGAVRPPMPEAWPGGGTRAPGRDRARDPSEPR